MAKGRVKLNVVWGKIGAREMGMYRKWVDIWLIILKTQTYKEPIIINLLSLIFHFLVIQKNSKTKLNKF